MTQVRLLQICCCTLWVPQVGSVALGVASCGNGDDGVASSSGAHGCNDDSEDEASREEAAWDSQSEPVDLWYESALWMNKQWSIGRAVAAVLAFWFFQTGEIDFLARIQRFESV